MKKAICVILTVLAGILALVLLVIVGFNIYLRASSADFYSKALTHGKVPGISDGFIHQGISYVSQDEIFISCGYMNDGTPSRIYLFDGKNEKYVTLNDLSGEPSMTHAGGLTYWSDIVFLTNGKGILVYSWDDIKASAENCASVDPSSSFDVGFNAAFCYADGNDLYVGEFYREENYPTDISHHMTTPSGDIHHALMARYDLEEMFENGFEKAVPTMIYSVPDLAQGMCLTPSGRICISTSYAVALSHIFVYDVSGIDQGSMTTAKASEIDFISADTPLVFLDSSTLSEDVRLFPMSEELVLVGGRVYIMNESASSKYIFGKLTGGSRLYSIEID